MTKEEFISKYRDEIVNRYAWAQNVGKLDRFMQSVKETLSMTQRAGGTWNHSGEAVTAAWQAIGGKGKPKLIQLRALA